MNKYKINIIFNNGKDINDILIRVLNKELKKYIQIIRENDESGSSIYLSLEGDKNC